MAIGPQRKSDETKICELMESIRSIEALQIELTEIYENLFCGDLSAAEHAILTGQRSELMQELAAQNGTLSQFATASKQAFRRAGDKPGHHVGSVRDQAKRTGAFKDKLQRSMRRWEILGSRLLYKIVGTTLDSVRELDVLGQLPEAERGELAKRAASGERVTARTLLSLKSRERRKRRRARSRTNRCNCGGPLEGDRT